MPVLEIAAGELADNEGVVPHFSVVQQSFSSSYAFHLNLVLCRYAEFFPPSLDNRGSRVYKELGWNTFHEKPIKGGDAYRFMSVEIGRIHT
jgi:hypothetical protein